VGWVVGRKKSTNSEAAPPSFPRTPFLANLGFADDPRAISHRDDGEHATCTYRAFSNQVDCFQLGFGFHAGSLTVPLRAFTTYCTCESAMNAVFSGLTSRANDAGNLALSSSK